MDVDRARAGSLVLCCALLAALAPLSYVAGCGGGIASEPEPDAAEVDAGPAEPPAAGAVLPRDAGADSAPPPDPWGKVEDRPTSAVVTIDLGDVGANQEVSFTVPPLALGFNVGIRTPGASDTIEVTSVTSPSGANMTANATVYNGDHETTTTFHGDVAAAGIPCSNHPDMMPQVSAGTWKAWFNEPGRAVVRVQATPDGQFHGGYVDMHVYLPEGLTIDGEVVDAKSYAKLAGARDRVDALAKVMRPLFGLDRGNVTFHLIGPEFVQAESSGEVGMLFEQSSAGGDGQALHVFLVEPTSSQDWWGIAGGLPGIANVAGTKESAVALAIADAAEVEGQVLAHEMGHFFGLSHTTELDSGGYDALEDTPKCPGMTFSNHTKCPDVDNVMFATGSGSNLLKTSPLQRRIMQGSPVYRAFLTGTPPATGFAKGADLGKLFGHPGVPPSGAEIAVLAALCGHRAHRAQAEGLVRQLPRSALLTIASAPGAKAIVRNRARSLAALAAP